MIRKLYKFSYAVGSILIILSMLLSILPAFPARAGSGTVWTTNGTCNNPQDKNHYVAGDDVGLRFEGYDPNSTLTWTIEGQPGNASCDAGVEVARGETTVDANGDGCVIAYTVKMDDCGEYQVKVNGVKGDNYRVDEGGSTPSPDFTLSKSASPTSVVFPGDDVTFAISITNTGNQDLILTQLTDSVFTSIGTCAGLVGSTLATGATATCSFTGYVSGAAGTNHENTFAARATSGQDNLEASDNAIVYIQAPPTLGVTVQKSASPTSIQSPGGPINYSVLVTNTSNVAVSLTSLVDDKFSDLGTCVTPQTLAEDGGTYSCEFTGSVLGAAGYSHTNTITATINHSSGSATGSDSATVQVIDQTVLGIDVTKTANPTSVVEPGDDVTFTISVENQSNVDAQLTSLTDTIYDDLNGQGSCVTGQTIAAGATYSCTVTKTISSAHTNTVTGVLSYNGQTVSDSATASVAYTLRPNPTINVTKTANPAELDEPGGLVNFTISVQNTSATPVTINSMIDSVFNDLNNVGTCKTGVEIPSQGTYSCSFERNLLAATANPHNNTVTVQVVDDLKKTASDSDSAQVVFNPLPTISVSKSATPSSVSELGGDVAFSILVTNTSDEALSLTSLSDSIFGDLNGKGSCVVPQTLSASVGTYGCSFTANLIGSPGTPHTNVVTAKAQDSDGNLAQAQDNEQVGFDDQLPSISVEKTAFPTSIDEPGGYIDFTFKISNLSQESVAINSLEDSVYGDLSQVAGCTNVIGQNIPAYGSYSCTISGLVTGNAADVHQNTVTAMASDNDGNSTTAQDDASVTITNVPTVIEVTKSASPSTVAEPGSDVTFTVKVDNLTDEEITLTNLSDDVYGDLNGQGDCVVPQTIAGSSSYSCSFSGAVDGDAGDTHINTVTGTAEDNDGSSASDTGSARVAVTDSQPEIQVSKSASPSSAPAPMAAFTYTIEVENLSAEAVTLTQLADDKFGDLNGTGDCLIGGSIPAGDSYSCSFIKNIAGSSGDSHTNIATATVSDNEGNSVSDFDDETVSFTSSPELILVDPCTVGCDLPNVTGQICNGDEVNNYTGTITWTAYVDNTAIGGGTVQGIPAGECAALSTPTQGDGLYTIVAVLVDEDNRTLTTECGPLVCYVPPRVTPTPIPPVEPPTGTPPGVFIPVTGMDLSGNGLISMMQNFGLALFSFGLVLQGFTLREKKQGK